MIIMEYQELSIEELKGMSMEQLRIQLDICNAQGEIAVAKGKLLALQIQAKKLMPVAEQKTEKKVEKTEKNVEKVENKEEIPVPTTSKASFAAVALKHQVPHKVAKTFKFPDDIYFGKKICKTCNKQVHLVQIGEFEEKGKVDYPKHFFNDDGSLHEHQSCWFVRNFRCDACNKHYRVSDNAKIWGVLDARFAGIPLSFFEIVERKVEGDKPTCFLKVHGQCNH